MTATTQWMAWALAVVVPASVGWLALHGWRQGRTLRRWAGRRGYRIVGRGDDRLDADVAAFEMDSRHLRRRLDKVRDVAAGRRLRFFRCLETLDLSPWRGGTGPPKTRVAVLFDVRGGCETHTVVDTDGRGCRSIPPGLRFSDPVAAGRIESRLPGPPPHPLSVTLRPAEGLGLAYMLPPSGTVSDADLDYLARLAARLSEGGRPERRVSGPADGRLEGPADGTGGPGRARVRRWAAADGAPGAAAGPDRARRAG